MKNFGVILSLLFIIIILIYFLIIIISIPMFIKGHVIDLKDEQKNYTKKIETENNH